MSVRALLVCALALPACSYDLDALRGLRDVRGTDAADAIAALDVADAEGTDADADAGEFDAGNQCTTRVVSDPRTDGTAVGASLVITSSTRFQTSRLTPPTLAPGCNLNYSDRPSPERVFRYVVESGPTLHATTDAPWSETSFDTIVYIRTSCEQDTGEVLVCNDDDRVLDACACSMGMENCPRLDSSAIAEGLSPGQVVYVVVDGYAGRAGSFRLVLTENALHNAPPPSSGLSTADRCASPSSLDTQLGTVRFPQPDDTVTSSAAPRLAMPGDRLSGNRMMPFVSISGAALEFRLAANNLGGDGGCADARATLDLLANNVVIHSFYVTPRTPVGTPVRVAYQTFGALSLTPSTPVQVSLRLREIAPAGCGSITVDTNAAGTLTLVGH